MLPENVKLSETELEKLIDRYGEWEAMERIETLSHGKGAHGYKYKSDYRAILMWEHRENKRGFRGHLPGPVVAVGNLTVTNRTPDFQKRRAEAIHTMFKRDFERGLRVNVPTIEEIQAKLAEDLQ